MPKKTGLRDDDVMSRLADLERRMDEAEQPKKRPSVGEPFEPPTPRQKTPPTRVGTPTPDSKAKE